MTKYGRLAKLYFEEGPRSTIPEGKIKVEYHKLEENVFCSGATFVSKSGGGEEDDGFIVSYVHDEVSSISQVSLVSLLHEVSFLDMHEFSCSVLFLQVLIIDAKKFKSQPIATITLPNSALWFSWNLYFHAA